MQRKSIALVILLGAVTIGGGVLLSRALFSDTERSDDNTFTAGTLDLTVGGANGTAFENIVVENIGADGTVSGSKTWTIRNAGTVPGNLTLSLTDLLNLENGCNEPEAIVDTTCDNPGPGQGELGDAVATRVTLNRGNGEEEVVVSNLADENMGQYATQWNANAGTVTVPGGSEVTVTMDWSTSPEDYGNEIQSDSLEFTVQFDLVQVLPS